MRSGLAKRETMLVHVAQHLALEVVVIALPVRARTKAGLALIAGDPPAQQTDVDTETLGYFSEAIATI
ncbi:hypothetical protein D3C78_1400240 [compost metagenome]